MSFREYLSRLRDYWVAVVVIIVGVLCATWVYTGLQGAEYSARSTVLVSARVGTTVQELQQGTNFIQGRVTTYETLVTTPVVLEKVIAELDLKTTPGLLARHIEAVAPELTPLIQIAVTYPDAALAARIANSVAESLISVVGEIEPVVLTGDAADQATPLIRVTVVESASVPASPSSPNWVLNSVLALAVGAVLALTAVAVISTLDTRIRGVRDVRRFTNAPILGRIAHGRRVEPLPIVTDPRTPRAESYRSLRTNVRSLAGGASHSFAVTSSTTPEMRTATVLNLAIAMMQAGSRVVVVDANLREPMVAELLELPVPFGLSDVLLGNVAIDEAVHRWKETSLFVLPAGGNVSNPSELLSSASMGSLIRDLESEFDVVLVDTPAALPVTDAAVVAKWVGATIIVCTAGLTKRGQLAEVVETIEQANATVAGIVLMLPRRTSTVDDDVTQFESIPSDGDGDAPGLLDVRASRQRA